MGKKELTYYDMGDRMANMYKPIDEYLKLSKRFSPKAMKRKFIGKIICCVIILIMLLAVSVMSILQGGASGIMFALFMMIFAIADAWMLSLHIKHFGEEVDEDILAVKNILDKDGLAEVHKDYSGAVEFTKGSLIGKNYIFIKGKTLVRLRDVREAVLDVRREVDEDGISESYCFTLHVDDEMGKRSIDLEGLSSNEKNRSKRFDELRSIMEIRQKRIEQIEL